MNTIVKQEKKKLYFFNEKEGRMDWAEIKQRERQGEERFTEEKYWSKQRNLRKNKEGKEEEKLKENN